MSRLRLFRDLVELDLPPKAHIILDDSKNPVVIEVALEFPEGFWKDCKIDFVISVGEMYPFQPPTVRVVQRVFHPNLDPGGGVCLNILRLGWLPSMDLNSVIYGLYNIFLEPGTDEPLTMAPAKLLLDDPVKFAEVVRYLATGQGEGYDKILL